MKTLGQALLSGALILSALPVLAGRLVGNGGDGLRVGDVVYSLDLVEAGVETNPYIASLPVREEFAKAFVRKFKALPYFPQELFLQKLTEIHAESPELAYALASIALRVNWSFVDHKIVDVDDEESLVAHDRENLVQLAIRRELNVLVSKLFWLRLPDAHKVGLIIHELVYYMVPVESVKLGDQEGGSQSSLTTRQVTGQLFKEGWTAEGIKGFLGKVFRDARLEKYFGAQSGLIGKGEYRWDGDSRFSRLPEKSGRFVIFNGAQRNADDGYTAYESRWPLPVIRRACAYDQGNRHFAYLSLNVAPAGEEWVLKEQKFCLSLKDNGRCREQSAFFWSTVDARDHSGFKILKNRLFKSSVANCERNLRERMLDISSDPYADAGNDARLAPPPLDGFRK